MANFLGFGFGTDGALSVAAPTTDAPINASASGTIATTSVAATNASFAAGQYILIIQMRGTGVGSYEVNKIASYVAGTITTVLPTVNTYTDSGDSQAQVIVFKQYSSVSITSTLTPKAWDGNVGGVLAFLCNGRVTGTGNIAGQGANGQIGGNGTSTGNGGGFRGGNATHTSGVAQGFAGEGTVGPSVAQTSANSTGGGGAKINNVASAGFGGAGAGHVAAGNPGTHDDGTSSGAGSLPGVGGNIGGIANLLIMIMGGGGGGGANDGSEPAGNNPVGSGANGGVIVFIMADYIDCSLATGLGISVNGGNGGNAGPTAVEGGDGGAGSAGTIFIKARTALVDPAKVTAIGGIGGTPHGGNGSDGRIRVEACTLTGTTNPSNTATAGGYSWCGFTSAVL